MQIISCDSEVESQFQWFGTDADASSGVKSNLHEHETPCQHCDGQPQRL